MQSDACIKISVKINFYTVPEHKHFHIHQMIPLYIEDLQ